MAIFTVEIVKILHTHKAITKKYMAANEWRRMVERLALRRKDLRNDSDKDLYLKGQMALEYMEKWMQKNEDTNCWYSGIDEFYQHLQSMLDEYRVEENQVIHTSQQASRTMIEAIQLIDLPAEQHTKAVAIKLENCGKIIAKFGSKEQQSLYLKMLHTRQERHVTFFLPLVNGFKRALFYSNSHFTVKWHNNE